MLEVELAYKVNDFTGVRNRLKYIGAKFVSKGRCVKIIYKCKSDLNMVIYPDRAILRLKPGKGQKELPLTRMELETGIEDPEVMHNILIYLGYHVDGVLKRVREKHVFGKIEVNLDEDVAKVVELELKIENQNMAESAKNELIAAAKPLGLGERLTKEHLMRLADKHRAESKITDNVNFGDISAFLSAKE
jgi:predicted adenylyl cyclase CyaB